MFDLTIIIPVYNEELSIKKTINNLCSFIQDKNWEIIAVNDGSTDQTEEILSKYSNITVIHHPYNRGYGAALKTGIKNARSHLVAFYDADGQHNPDDLGALYENIANYDMLVGQRCRDSYKNSYRVPGKWILGKVANYLTGTKIPDINSGLRIIKRVILKRYLHLFSDSFSFSTTSTIALLNLGFNVGYYPIKVNQRIGKSTVKQFKHGTDTIILILRLILLFNPLKVFLPISKFLFILAFIIEIIDGVIRCPDGIKITRAALSIFLTSVIIFFFGLVVDQISELRKHLSLNNYL